MRLYITGNIGVGKSTLATYIAKKYNYIHYPEFNSYNEGAKLLSKRLCGDLHVTDFQIEIMNIYNIYRKYEDNKDYVIERLASENYNIFTDENDKDYVYSIYRMLNIDEPHAIHVYSIDITNGIDSIKDDIDKIITQHSLTNIYPASTSINICPVSTSVDVCIYLYTDINTLMNRIHTRARQGEEIYDINYIQKIQDKYNYHYGFTSNNPTGVHYVDLKM